MSEEAIRKKRSLRAESRARRTALDETARRAASDRMADKFFEIVTVAKDDVVAAYWPLEGEADIRPVLSRLAARGVACALPVVVEREAPLVFRRWAEGDDMATSGFGVSEPLPEAEEVTPTLVLVPLLAWDERGHRLGYGGGFYDRTLAQLRAGNPGLRAYGYAFACQRMDGILPSLQHDMTLDGVITEHGMEKFGDGT